MGDRSNLSLLVRKADKEIWNEIGLFEWDDDAVGPDGQVNEGLTEDLNNGGLEELKLASRRGAVFVAAHSAGDEYGPYSLASDGRIFTCALTNHHGEFVVSCRVSIRKATATPRKGSLLALQQHLRVLRDATALLKADAKR